MPKKKTPEVTLRNMPFQLRSIYLRNSSSWMATEFDPLISAKELFPITRTTQGKVDCRVATRKGGDVEETIRSCTYRITYEFAYTSIDANKEEEIEKSMVAKITAELSVDYLLTADEFPEQNVMKAWGSSTAMAHTWPYWREYCQSVLMRMNLPVTIIPMLNLVPGNNKLPAADTAPPPSKRARPRQKKTTPA